ncbi:MAG: hypothetical protein M1828_001856 [Chrysothrix sp. TS-e1954]|nr:MAG: hypothetical protein M1828_001856 [Chrysothrix sp. TS-e1954]
MPTELEELVGFLHHGNTEIRRTAIENLVGYSKAQPSIFKTDQLTPVKDLKLLVKDYPAIAKNVLTILINIAEDREVLESLAKDDAFLETLMLRITDEKEPNANEMAMLFANLAKADETLKLLQLRRNVPKTLSKSAYAIDQLMDCFVKGAEGGYNKDANFDYLSFFFADMAKSPDIREYFVTPQLRDDNIIPLTKLTVFTEHRSKIRRRGVAATIKNVTFDVASHPRLLSAHAPDGINILPYILLPLMGPEEYSDEDTEGMLEDLQLLPPDKTREVDVEIIKTHLETLLLLTTERSGRDHLRAVKVYPIIRELHIHADDEGIQEACDRFVQVIMRDEEGETTNGDTSKIEDVVDDDEDDQIIDVL